jgi:hypothetical protein
MPSVACFVPAEQRPSPSRPWGCTCPSCEALPPGSPSVPRDYPERGHRVNRLYRSLAARGAAIPAVLREEFAYLSECVAAEAPELYWLALGGGE